MFMRTVNRQQKKKKYLKEFLTSAASANKSKFSAKHANVSGRVLFYSTEANETE
jgi:hypothetical protein